LHDAAVWALDARAANVPPHCGVSGIQLERGIRMKRDELDGPLEWDRATEGMPFVPPRVIDLSLAGKGNYVRRKSRLAEALWFVLEACVINNKLVPFSALRVALLRLFGAKIGTGCRFVHPLRVKAPWNLEVGVNCWFGVDAWIYNQAPIRIGSNVCISQGVFLTSGSHEAAGNMDLQVAPIVIEDGVWISSKCVVQKGVTIGRSAVVTPLSVVNRSLPAAGIYGGNPCRFIRQRFSS
jgi:putative colanic acid biosynthesis acetyltransferase WcaF